MTCLIDLNLFYIIIEIFNIKSLVTSIIPELFWLVKNCSVRLRVSDKGSPLDGEVVRL